MNFTTYVLSDISHQRVMLDAAETAVTTMNNNLMDIWKSIKDVKGGLPEIDQKKILAGKYAAYALPGSVIGDNRYILEKVVQAYENLEKYSVFMTKETFAEAYKWAEIAVEYISKDLKTLEDDY